MASIRTHNTRARNKLLSRSEIDMRRALKLCRIYRKRYPTIRDFQREFVDRYFRADSPTGRMVRRGPEMQHYPTRSYRTDADPVPLIEIDYNPTEQRIMDTLSRKADVHAELAARLDLPRPDAKMVQYAAAWGMTERAFVKMMLRGGGVVHGRMEYPSPFPKGTYGGQQLPKVKK